MRKHRDDDHEEDAPYFTVRARLRFGPHKGEGKDKPPGYGTVLMFTIQMRQILRTNIDGKAIDGDGEWLFHYFGWPNPSDTTYFALKMDPTHGFRF